MPTSDGKTVESRCDTVKRFLKRIVLSIVEAVGAGLNLCFAAHDCSPPNSFLFIVFPFVHPQGMRLAVKLNMFTTYNLNDYLNRI